MQLQFRLNKATTALSFYGLNLAIHFYKGILFPKRLVT